MDETKQMIVEELVKKEAQSVFSRWNDLSGMLRGFPNMDVRENTSIRYDRIEVLAQLPLLCFGGKTWRALWDLPSQDEFFENIMNFFKDDGPNGFNALIKEHKGELEIPKAIMVIGYSDLLANNELYPIVVHFPKMAKSELVVLINHKL